MYRPPVRAFESFDWSAVKDGELILMTVEELGDPKARMKIADFRDVQALFITEFKKWIGMSPSRGLRFGSGPPWLVNGIWYCAEDVVSQRGREDLSLSPEALSLEMIR